MGVLHAQNVGIKTALPASKLSIAGNLSIGSSYAGVSAPANGAIIEGNVGIGTTAPTAKLHISEGDIEESNGSNGFIMHSRSGFGYDFWQLAPKTAGTYEWSKGITLVRSTGNVGIGTTNPGEKLEVIGDVRLKSNSDVTTTVGSGVLQILNAAGTAGIHLDVNEIQALGNDLYINVDNQVNTHINNLVHINKGGSVGIGTAAPASSAKLDISSTTGGILIPRMTTAQRDAIASPDKSLLIFNTTTKLF